MPELPEVETTRQALAGALVGSRVRAVVKRSPGLRWPFDADLGDALVDRRIVAVARRAKYLRLCFPEPPHLLLHLGMSGTLRVVAGDVRPGRHDHLDLVLGDDRTLRFRDPRRFGCALLERGPGPHPLLVGLGPEPLDAAFGTSVLVRAAAGRRVPIKALLMDQRVVVGVGNIYAAEALFLAGVRPTAATGSLSRHRLGRIVQAVREVLDHAIRRGGTTLRDFLAPDGRPGYFEQELLVYGRAGQPCRRCGSTIRSTALSGRASCYCPRCQRR